MNTSPRFKEFEGIFQAILFLVAGIVLVPLATVILFGTNFWDTFGFVGSVLILQPMAVVVGVGIGITPIPIMLIMISFGISIIYGLFAICDTFAERSVWLRNHLNSVQTIAGKSSFFQRYGIFTLMPFIWIPGIGLYGCVLLAWMFKWRGVKGVGVIMAGWILSSLLVLGASIGILSSIH